MIKENVTSIFIIVLVAYTQIMNESQLIKGILEGCVLAIIAKEETYGYEIINQLELYGFDNIIEGTLYPILSRLNKKGLISGRSMKSPFGPIRKNYSITEEGLRQLNDFRKSYASITEKADIILFGRREGNETRDNV